MENRYKAALSYVGLYLTGIFFLALEKENEFVRKSAAQSFVLSITAILTHGFLMIIPLIGSTISVIFDVLFIVLLIFLILKSLKKIYFKLPIISDISEKYVIHWFL